MLASDGSGPGTPAASTRPASVPHDSGHIHDSCRKQYFCYLECWGFGRAGRAAVPAQLCIVLAPRWVRHVATGVQLFTLHKGWFKIGFVLQVRLLVRRPAAEQNGLLLQLWICRPGR